jgi:hypothetical protein
LIAANRCAALRGWADHMPHRSRITLPPMLALLRIFPIDVQHPAV